MLTRFVHRRAGKVIQEPDNFREIELKKAFVGEKTDVSVDVSRLVFSGSEAKNIKERIFNGLLGGVGCFESDTYEIEIADEGSETYVFNGILDYSDDPQIIGENRVGVALKEKTGSDWLNEVADAFSFRYLYDIGVIKDADFVKVPYVINFIPDFTQVALAAIGTFLMTKELINATRQLAQSVGDGLDAAAPVVGVMAGFGFGAVIASDVGNFISVAATIAARIIAFVLIVIAVINLIKTLFEQLFSPVRYHSGIKLIDLFKKGCEHLGLTLKSDLLQNYKDWVVIPSKQETGGDKITFKPKVNQLGIPSLNDPFDSFGDLVRVWKQVFDADYQIVDGEFIFENRHFFETPTDFVIKDYFSNQADLRDEYSLNTSEIAANYNIAWTYDLNDENTVSNSTGMVFQAVTEANAVNDKKLVTLKNLEEIKIPCSIGVEKSRLTPFEKILRALCKLADNVTSVLSLGQSGTGLAAKIDKRASSLLLSSHYISIPKVVVMNGGGLAKNQRGKLAARKLWDQFHFKNSFAPINDVHNQYRLHKNVKIPFTIADFAKLSKSNVCKTQEGEDALIETLKWKKWEDYAVIDYRVKYKYTDNLKLKYIE